MNKTIKNNIKKYILIILIVILIVIFILLVKKNLFNKNDNFQNNSNNNLNNNSISSVNKKIYVICKKTEYNYMEDYVLSFYKHLNAEIIVFNDENDIPAINKTDIFIFLQNMDNMDSILKNINSQNTNIYILNTEQLSSNIHYQRLNNYPKNIKMLDYSKANMKYYNGYYNKFLSYQLNFDEIYNLPKTNDMCIMSGESPYRRNIINEITNKGYKLDIISGWKKERDEKLFTYKILVNISYKEDYKIFETLRCDRCIFNRMIVISDKKENMDLYYLKDYMIFEDYDKIANKAIEVLNNYDMYYKKLGLDTMDLNKLPIEPVSL